MQTRWILINCKENALPVVFFFYHALSTVCFIVAKIVQKLPSGYKVHQCITNLRDVPNWSRIKRQYYFLLALYSSLVNPSDNWDDIPN